MKAVLLAALLTCACAAIPSAQAEERSFEAALAEASGYEVVFVGEVHDNPYHHLGQARFAAALKPRAIVFEMLRPEDLPIIRQNADPRIIARALNWTARGWPDFSQYHQIIAAAPDAVLFGAEVPRAALKKAVADGAAKAFGEGAARFGLDLPLDPAQQSAREGRQAAAHCDKLPADMLPGMVEAQRLRDAALAQAILRARELPGTGPILVIAGNGHLQETWGAPALLARAAPEMRVFTFGQYEAAPASPPVTAWYVTQAVERPDPCASLN